MIRWRWYESGALFGLRYEMAPGDALPVHTHDATTAHNVIVLEGEVDLIVADQRIAASAGAVLDFDGAKYHTVRAITPAVILNLFLNGMPPDYRNIPAAERAGTYSPT